MKHSPRPIRRPPPAGPTNATPTSDGDGGDDMVGSNGRPPAAEPHLPPLTGPAQPGPPAPPPVVDADVFRAGCGESLQEALDVTKWQDALDLTAALSRLEREVDEAADQQNDLDAQVRRQIFPQIATLPGAPPGAGIYKATATQLRRVQASTLLNGGVEACDGTAVAHDTLPLTVTQIGVCLVSYLGDQGAWGHRLFRRDLRVRSDDPLQDAFDLLARRSERGSPEHSSRRDQLSELIRRGAMTYAERAVLTQLSTAPWRLGHGQPVPYELLTGSGSTDLLHMGLAVTRKLILDHQRFVFVPSKGDRMLLSLGAALRPLEFMIFDTTERQANEIVEHGHLRGEHRRAAEDFVREVSPKVVVGVYRTYPQAPPQMFYAHVEHAQQAALIAMADSVLQPHRSFPTLIDLADNVVTQLFGPEAFDATVQGAYARRGDPLRFLNERETRRG